MPATKILLSAAAACFLLALAVPTVAITIGEDDADNDVVLESSSPYASVDGGEISLDFEALNDRSVTRTDDAFAITVSGDDIERLWIDHDVPGLEFYRSDRPSAAIDQSNPLEPSTDRTTGIGVAVDTHDAVNGTETFTITVQYADGGNESNRSRGGSQKMEPVESPGVERSEFDVSPTSLEAGETVTATTTYRNPGGAATTVTASLTVDGTVVDRRTVTLAPGKSKTVAFERPMEWPGTYDVGIEGAGSASVTVEGPPVEVEDATVENPSADGGSVDDADTSVSLTAGESATIRAAVRNPTDARVERTLELAVDGIVVDSRAVSIPANGERTVTFERRFDESGTYEISVSGVSAGTVTVEERETLSIRNRELSPSTTAALAPPATAGLLFLAMAANRRWAFVG